MRDIRAECTSPGLHPQWQSPKRGEFPGMHARTKPTYGIRGKGFEGCTAPLVTMMMQARIVSRDQCVAEHGAGSMCTRRKEGL